MKKILLLIVIAVAAKFGWDAHKNKQNPATIDNPVYAEMRVRMGDQSRQLDGVMFIKAADEADCRKNLGKLDGILSEESCKKANCSIVSSECKTELTARNARLFDNEPTFVSYLSLARSKPELRETRLIVWGVSVEESDQLCQRILATNAHRAAQPVCISARR